MTPADRPKRKQDRLDGKYWICDVCIVAKGLTTKYPTGGNTMCEGECNWCHTNGMLTPIVDFKESGSKQWD